MKIWGNEIHITHEAPKNTFWLQILHSSRIKKRWEQHRPKNQIRGSKIKANLYMHIMNISLINKHKTIIFGVIAYAANCNRHVSQFLNTGARSAFILLGCNTILTPWHICILLTEWFALATITIFDKRSKQFHDVTFSFRWEWFYCHVILCNDRQKN